MSRQLHIRCINVCGKMDTGYKTKVTTVNVTQGDGDIRPSTDTRHRNRIISYLHGNTDGNMDGNFAMRPSLSLIQNKLSLPGDLYWGEPTLM